MAEAEDVTCCGGLIEVQTWVTNHDKRHATIDEILDKLMNRLPLWATFMLTGAGTVIGILVTIIGFLMAAR